MRLATTIRRKPPALATLGASMRVRLTLWYLAILALVFLVFSGIVVGEAQRNEEAAQHAELANFAQMMANSYQSADGLLHIEQQPIGKILTPLKTKAQPPVNKAFLMPAQVVALFIDTQGRVTQTFGPLTADGIARLQDFLYSGASPTTGTAGLAHAAGVYGDISLPVDTASPGDQKTLAYAAYTAGVISQGRLVGTLVVATPNTLKQTAASVIPALLIAGPVTLLLAAIGGYWLASRALRPVRLITRAAQQISETDLSRRLRLNSRDEIGELAATFDHMLGRLEAAFQRQRQFTADASHELRTPLTIINLEVTRALAAPRAPQEYERALSVIQAENLAMSRLVGDLLTLARADAGRAQVALAPLDLSDVALEAVERLTPLARQRGIHLVVEALPAVDLLGDRTALAQALMNLVENGIKYTAGVGSRVTVATRYDHADGQSWAVARVADDGPGIAPEHLPHLFDRFYRVDAARTGGADTASADDTARDGSGLGLAIAQWAAQAHGGELRVQSEVGVGSTFEVWLPTSEAATKLLPERSSAREAAYVGDER